MDDPSDELVIAASRWKAAKLLAFGGVLIACGVYLVLRPEIGLRPLGFLGTAFFLAASVYAAYRVVRPGIAVSINSEGVEDRASAFGVGLIRWGEVESARVYDVLGHAMVGIVPRRIDEFVLAQPWWRRFAIRANVKLGFDPINIPEAFLPVTAAQILGVIRRHLERRGSG